MKKLLFTICLAVLLTACSEDFLEKKPVSDVSPEVFFKKESDLLLYTNSFYKMLPSTSIYNGERHTDNIIENRLSEVMRSTRTVPTRGGGWTWGYLRKINYFLENNTKVKSENVKNHYNGVARFFRAYFYFQKVKRFGDVPWYDKVIKAEDSQLLNKARDNRSLVVKNILKDLDYSIQNLRSEKKSFRVTKWTALALKSRVALYEGTYQKYRNIKGYEYFLKEAYKAAKKLMDSQVYSIYSSGNPNKDYLNLFASHNAIPQEIILARQFLESLNIDHNVNYYTVTSSYGRPSMPKDLVNSYLMKDGSRYTDLSGYNKKMFYQEMQNRDPRLSQTIRTPGYKRIGETTTLPPNLAAASTGYQLIKYVTEKKYDTNDASITDLPLFRYAEALLNYAEAKAELNTLTQNDLDISINKIRNRIAMPHIKLNSANTNIDKFIAAQYKNVKGNNKGVILEIRRERRIELYMENFRWDDIVRWKEGQKLTQKIRGMYLPGEGKYDLDGNKKIDLVLYKDKKPSNKQQNVLYMQIGKDLHLDRMQLIDPHPKFNNRSFDEKKDYLYPIPTLELQLNPNLKQNPGW